MVTHIRSIEAIYRCRWKDSRAMMVLEAPTNDTRLLIWLCEQYWKQRWPTNAAGDFYAGATLVLAMHGFPISINYAPNSTNAGQSPDEEFLQVTRADEPFRDGEIESDWVGVPVIAVTNQFEMQRPKTN
jgi:hypothetical protein